MTGPAGGRGRPASIPDRTEAGRRLAPPVRQEGLSDAVVIGVERGGLAVAAEIARELGAPLDLLLVEEIDVGDPLHPPAYVGAVGDSGLMVLHPEITDRLQDGEDRLDAAVSRARGRLHRRAAGLRVGGHPLELTGRSVVLVDDGTSEPDVVRAAVELTRAAGTAWVALALPAAPAETLAEMASWADQVICPEVQAWFTWFYRHHRLYDDERLPGEDEARRLLACRGGGSGPSA